MNTPVSQPPILDQTILTKSLVKSIIAHPLAHGRAWSFQGMGMLRLYLTSRLRMHIWCPSRATPDVSTLHTHPWDFVSVVVAGLVQNRLYTRHTSPCAGSRPYFTNKIKCGAGGGLVDIDCRPLHVRLSQVQVVKEGETYSEAAEVVHESVPVEGTVTVVDRVFKQDTEHAYVFWPEGKEWVSAEPRNASPEEVEYFCNAALSNWFLS